MTSYIYVMECAGFVKIGLTQNPNSRLAICQTFSPFPVRLIGFLEGTRQQEAALHAKLSAHRVRGEWFRMEGAVADYIEYVEVLQYDVQPIEHLRRYCKEERGRLTRLAADLGVTPSTITQWHQVPIERTLQVERATGIPRQRLRPDFFMQARAA